MLKLNKTPLIPYYCVWMFIASLMPAWGEEGTRPEELKIYTMTPVRENDDSQIKVNEIESIPSLKEGDYRVNVLLGLKKEKNEKIVRSVDLVPREALSNSKPMIEAKNLYPWVPAKKKNAYKLFVAPKNGWATESSFDFKSMEVEYEDLMPSNPSMLEANITVTQLGLKKEYKVTLEKDNSREWEFVKTINFGRDDWTEKDFKYLFNRELNSTIFDPGWKYTWSNKKTVVQRRFNLPLGEIVAIDVKFREEDARKWMEKLECNFRISYEGRAGKSEILSCRDLPRDLLQNKELDTVRFDFQKIVTKRLKKKGSLSCPGPGCPVLAEIIYFFPVSPEELERDRFIDEIIFWKDETTNVKLKERDKRNPVFDPGSTVPFVGSKYKKTKMLYLISRELGLKPDPTWRVSQEDSVGIFQRRLHKSINAVNFLNITFSPKTNLGEPGDYYVGCKLRIGFDKKKTEYSETVKCDDLEQAVIKNNRGNTIRVKLSDLLLKYRLEGREEIFLEEIEVYIRGEYEALIRSKSFLYIMLDKSWSRVTGIDQRGGEIATTDKDEKSSVIENEDGGDTIIAKVEKNNQGKNIFKVNLNELRSDLLGREGENAYIEEITLSFSPKNKGAFGGLRLLSSKMLHTEEVLEASFIVEGDKNLSKWGGPFLDFEPPDFEWPWVLGHINFKKAADNLIRLKGDRKKIEIYKDKTFKSRMDELGFDQLKDDVLGRNVSVTTSLHVDRVSVDEKGLYIKGEGEGIIEILWKLPQIIKQDNRLFLSVIRDELRIQNISVIPISSGYEHPAIEGGINRPIEIKQSENNIDELKIQLEVKKGGFGLVFDEMVLFRPALLSSKDILKAPSTVKKNIKLIPANIKLIGGKFETSGNSLDAMVSLGTSPQKSLTWETRVARKVDAINGIEINHWVLPEAVGGDPCWLQMNWMSSRHTVSKRICPGFNGSGFISVKNFPHELDPNEVIRSISWEAFFSSTQRNGFGMLHFDASIELASIDKLWERLVYDLNIFVTNENQAFFANEKTFEDIMNSKFLIELSPRVLGRFLEESSYKLETSDLYAKKIFIETINKKYFMGDVALGDLGARVTEFTFKEEYGILIYGLIFFLLIGFIRWLYIRYSPRLASSDLRRYIYSLLELLRRGLFIIFKYFKNHTKSFNRFLGLIVVFPGMWLAGNYNEGSAWNNELLVSLFVLLLVALWYELLLSYRYFSWDKKSFWRVFLFGYDEKIPWAIKVLTITVISWVIFQHGTGFILKGLQPQVISPILCLFYFYIPWFLFKDKQNKLVFFKNKLNKLRELLILIFGVTLYWVGILIHSIYGKGSNLFFSLGILVVLTVWCGFIGKVSKSFEHSLPNFWNEIKDRVSSQFILGALLFFGFTAIFRLVHLNEFAEPFGAIGFAMLLLGVFLEIKEQRKPLNNHLPAKSNHIQNSSERSSIA